MPTLTEIEEMNLANLQKTICEGVPDPDEQENLEYELEFRLQTIEWALKGGDRPTHTPPNP